MLKEVEVGNIMLPVEIINSVERHRQFMIDCSDDDYCISIIKRASFSMILSDYLTKNAYYLIKNDF